MWRSAQPMTIKSRKPTTMKTNNSLNLLESKLERSQRIREEEVEEEKEKMALDLNFKLIN